jgi:hypothetical protein
MANFSTEETQAFEAHLAECRECADMVRQFRETSQSLREWNAPPVSRRIEDAVEEQLQGADQGRGSRGSKGSFRPRRQAALEAVGVWRSERRSRGVADCGDRHFRGIAPQRACLRCNQFGCGKPTPSAYSRNGEQSTVRFVARRWWGSPAACSRSDDGAETLR